MFIFDIIWKYKKYIFFLNFFKNVTVNVWLHFAINFFHAAYHHHIISSSFRQGERKRWLQAQKWWVIMDMDAARKDQVMRHHLKQCLVRGSHLSTSLVFTLVIIINNLLYFFLFPSCSFYLFDEEYIYMICLYGIFRME